MPESGSVATPLSTLFQYSIGDTTLLLPGSVSPIKVVLSILHWRCRGHVTVLHREPVELGFQYSIGDATRLQGKPNRELLPVFQYSIGDADALS